MKLKFKLLLFLLGLTFAATAQETPPSGLKPVNGQFYIHLPDSTVWQNKGAPYGIQQLPRLKNISDSVGRMHYRVGLLSERNNLPAKYRVKYMRFEVPGDQAYILQPDLVTWVAAPNGNGSGGSVGASQADYVLQSISGVITATPRVSSNPTFTNSSASVVLQQVINLLASTGGGDVYAAKGNYPFTSEVTITGAATERPAKDQIKITGAGFATIFSQNAAGQNAFVVKNRASITFRDFFVNVGSAGKSAILLDVVGNSGEPSVFGGVIDNVFAQNNSSSYPCVWIKNMFDLHCPTLYVYNTAVNATALKVEQVPDPNNIRYGNSGFGYLRSYTNAGGTGLLLQGMNNYRPMNLLTFANYEFAAYGVLPTYGIYFAGASNCTFGMVDIEYCKFPIWLDNVGGDNTAQSINNKIQSAYLYPQGAGARAITVNNLTSGGNDFVGKIETDNGTTGLVWDKANFAGANRYDLSLGYAAVDDTNNVKLAAPGNTFWNVRPLSTPAYSYVSLPADNDVSYRPVPTLWVKRQNFLTQTVADSRYLNPYATNAAGPLSVDITGKSQNTARVDGALADLTNIGSDNILQFVGLGESDYKLKGYTASSVLAKLGIKQSAFFDYQPAKVDGQFFTNATTQTQPIYDNDASIATTAFVKSIAPLYFNSFIAVNTYNYVPIYNREVEVFEGGQNQNMSIAAPATAQTELLLRNGNTTGTVTISFTSGNNYEGAANSSITLAPGEFVWITYAYSNNWRLVYKGGSGGSGGAETDPVFAAQGEKKSNKVSTVTNFNNTDYPTTAALVNFLTSYYVGKGETVQLLGTGGGPAHSTSPGKPGDMYLSDSYLYYYSNGRWNRIAQSFESW